MKRTLVHLTVTAGERTALGLDAWQWAELSTAVQLGLIEQMTTKERWAWLHAGLMTSHPSNFFDALRRSGGLERLLPELARLFGVPQLSDASLPIDVGLHQLRVIDQTAAVQAPLSVRFAALVQKIGKSGTPREIWPSHYKHEQRAHELLQVIAGRIAVPEELLQFAHLVIDECERVHRASDKRAGAIAELIRRTQADVERERFEQLLCVCTCDYAAYAGHNADEYPKAPRLRRALAAYLRAPVTGLTEEAAQHARALAVANTLGSLAAG
jgi:tRNA nucleotidyltransferase (CCA-adding enzyme)